MAARLRQGDGMSMYQRENIANSRSNLLPRAQTAPVPAGAPAAAPAAEPPEEEDVAPVRADWTRRETVIYVASVMFGTSLFAYVACSIMIQSLLRITH